MKRGKIQGMRYSIKARHFMMVFTGVKYPSGKGPRLIVLHIGSDGGFINGLLLFQSKKTGDYHKDMNSERFIEWMHEILPSLDQCNGQCPIPFN